MEKIKLKRSRLDRFIAHHQQIPMRQAQQLIAQSKVTLAGRVVRNRQQSVSYLDDLKVNGVALVPIQPCYLMLNKPAGVLSATEDAEFITVIDLVPEALCSHKASLHYAGRLDRASTGLMLLTNDGRWSSALSHPQSGCTKRYSVTVENPIKPEDVAAFAKGFFFEYEQQRTQPAILSVTAERQADVVIQEGKYHQIKRMFAQCANRVVSLHRYQIGGILLDSALAEGEARHLTPTEIQSVFEK